MRERADHKAANANAPSEPDSDGVEDEDETPETPFVEIEPTTLAGSSIAATSGENDNQDDVIILENIEPPHPEKGESWPLVSMDEDQQHSRDIQSSRDFQSSRESQQQYSRESQHHHSRESQQQHSREQSSGDARLTDTLRNMTRRNRAAILRTIVHHLDSSDAHFLLELVKRKLSCDPLHELPPELAALVLSRMADATGLLWMARVCREWRTQVLGDVVLWRHHLKSMPLSRPARGRLEQAQTVSDYVNVLKYETLLRRNWQSDNSSSRMTIPALGVGVITCLQLDEEQGWLISGADNGNIGIWNVNSGECSALPAGHQGGVWTLKATKDGILVTGSTDRTLIVWDMKSGARIADLIGHSSTVRCVEIIGNYIVSGSRDGTLRVWCRRSGFTCLHILTGHTGSVRCIVPFGERYIVSGSYDHTLRVWDLNTGRCVATCAGHDGKVYSLAASDEYIFSGGIDAKIRVWRPLTGECVDVFSDHGALVGLLEIHGDYLVAGSTDGSLSLWNARTLHRLRFLELAHRSSITALGINRYAIISGSERALRLWSLVEMCSDEPPEPLTLSDKADVVWRVVAGETTAVVAYQQTGITRIELINFAP
ncbi:hypothetical protein PSACC_00686 [Paramicrosporidium saccamoebae]|uniref:F-box domain-containing protein n=1 Tax=Paramicrosporidium saccamoebae TaxID=1246581 RepID=A0A2H9TP17_9FUNG|nr:hypothetical protein PSACC_00686 [Paramicrosporidium saccamoebae]